jgi:hypothetical protein
LGGILGWLLRPVDQPGGKFLLQLHVVLEDAGGFVVVLPRNLPPCGSHGLDGWISRQLRFLLVVRESADLIVFLDYPRWVSFWRCAKRNWRYLFRSRPGLPENCPEIRIVPTLIRIIWQLLAT